MPPELLTACLLIALRWIGRALGRYVRVSGNFRVVVAPTASRPRIAFEVGDPTPPKLSAKPRKRR